MQALDINSTLKNAEEVGGSSATSKLAKAWEAGQTKKAFKAASLSLLALSLAACGNGTGTIAVNDDDDDAGGRTEGTAQALTSNTDFREGTDGDDTVEAGLVYTPAGNDRVNSLQNEDVVNLGLGSDTINITLGNGNDAASSIVTPTFGSVETVNVSFTSNNVPFTTSNDQLSIDEFFALIEGAEGDPFFDIFGPGDFEGGLGEEFAFLTYMSVYGSLLSVYAEQALDAGLVGEEYYRELDLQFSTGTKVVNVDRAVGDGGFFSVVGMEGMTDELSVTNATNDANVLFNYREGQLTGVGDHGETLDLALSDVRMESLVVNNGSRSNGSFEDDEVAFETVNITTAGSFANIDNFVFDVNGDSSNFDALSQDVTLTLGTDTEVNLFSMEAADTLVIDLGANDLTISADETDNYDEVVDANGNAVFGLDFGDAAFVTPNLTDQDDDDQDDDDQFGLTITGSGDALLNGVDGDVQLSDFDDNSANDEDDTNSDGRYTDDATTNTTGLTVDASLMTGNLHISFTDAVAGDDDSSLLSGSGDDVVRVDTDMEMDVTTGAGNDAVYGSGDLGANASVITGAGDDVVAFDGDMAAMGDSDSAPQDGGRDGAASIVTGAGNDTVEVGSMLNNIKWDDNTTPDADSVADLNEDDTYQYVAASINTGDGDDSVTVAATSDDYAMEENTSVDTGAGDDTFTFDDGGYDGFSFMETDVDEDQERVSVNEAVEDDDTVEDFSGASINLGAGDDTFVYVQSALADGGVTVVEEGNAANVGANGHRGGGVIDAGIGNDTMTVSSNDDVDVTDQTQTSFDDDGVLVAEETDVAIQVKGVETLNLHTQNVIYGDRADLSGATETSADPYRAEIEADISRFDSNLSTINLNADADLLTSENDSETFVSYDDDDEDGEAAHFDLENLDSSITVNLTARDTNGVEGFDLGGEIDTGAREDNLIEDVDLDVSVTNASGFDTAFTLNMFGDDTGNALGDFDIEININSEDTDLDWDGASETDDDGGNVEDVTLNIMTATSHGIDMDGFGDAMQVQGSVSDAEARTSAFNADSSEGYADTSLTITGSASGETIVIEDVRAQSITADIAADVEIHVSDENHYDIVTGSGDDLINLSESNVRADDSDTADVDERDTIDGGAGRDRLAINMEDDFGRDENGTLQDDDDWKDIQNIEDLSIVLDDTVSEGWVDGFGISNEDASDVLYAMFTGEDSEAFAGQGQQIVLDEDALVTGIQTLTAEQVMGFEGEGLQEYYGLRLTLGDDFETAGFTGTVFGEEIEDHFVTDLSQHTGTTYLRMDNRDDDTAEEVSNSVVALNANGGAVLEAVSLGDDRTNNSVHIAVNGLNSLAAEAEGLTPDNTFIGSADGFDALLLDADLDPDASEDLFIDYDLVSLQVADAGHYDEIVLRDDASLADGVEVEGSNIILNIDNEWIAADSTLTIDGSKVSDVDGVSGTGGALIFSYTGSQASASDSEGFIDEGGQILDITGTQNDDLIVAGDGEDEISGQSGIDWIQGDHIREDAAQIVELQFADRYQVGDSIQITIGGQTGTFEVTGNDITGNEMAQAVAAELTDASGSGSDNIAYEGSGESIIHTAVADDTGLLTITGVDGERYDVGADLTNQVLTQTIDFSASVSEETSGSFAFDVTYDGNLYTVTGSVSGEDSISSLSAVELEAAVDADNDGNADAFVISGSSITITQTMSELSGLEVKTVTDVELASATDASADYTLTTIGGAFEENPSVEVTQLITANSVFAADTLTGGEGNDTFAIYSSGQIVDGIHANIDHITDMDFGAVDAADAITFGGYWEANSDYVNSYTTGDEFLSDVINVGSGLVGDADGIVNQNAEDGSTIVIELTGETFEQAVADLFDAQGVFAEGDLNEVNSAGLFSYDDRDYVIAVGENAGGFGTDDFIVDVTGYTGTLSADALNGVTENP